LLARSKIEEFVIIPGEPVNRDLLLLRLAELFELSEIKWRVPVCRLTQKRLSFTTGKFSLWRFCRSTGKEFSGLTQP